MTTRALAEGFVEAYNRPPSDVYHLFSPDADWIERHSGRRGGWPELEAALRAVRDDFTDLHLDVRTIVAEGDNAIIECEWSGRRRSDGVCLAADVIWSLTFRDGLIVKEHDYALFRA